MKQRIIEIEEIGFPSSLIWRENAFISELINTQELINELFSEVKKLIIPDIKNCTTCKFTGHKYTEKKCGKCSREYSMWKQR